MKNTFGQSVSVTIYGESHGQAVGVVIDVLHPPASVGVVIHRQEAAGGCA